jgi:hypothetical protein
MPYNSPKCLIRLWDCVCSRDSSSAHAVSLRFRPRMRASMESTDLRTSVGEALLSEEVAVSLRFVFRVAWSFSTLKWAILKFFRRSSKGRRRRG